MQGVAKLIGLPFQLLVGQLGSVEEGGRFFGTLWAAASKNLCSGWRGMGTVGGVYPP